jgi:outer membrane receptor protein involved in Fe transport
MDAIRANHLCGVALASLAISAPLSAQVEQTHATAPNTVEDIIVTAQKRDERLLDVPVPVSVLPTRALAAQGVNGLDDYFSRLPGLSVSSRGNGRSTIAVRGITTGFGNSPTVATTLDDIPLGSSTGNGIGDQSVPEIDPADIGQVEVLRGPQGTLYGASSLGGLIKYVSVQPSLTKVGGELQATGSATEHGGLGYNTHAGFNIPLIEDKLGLRASGFYRRDAGYIDDPDHGQKDVNSGRIYGGKLSALWKPVTGVSLTATAILQNSKNNGSNQEDETIDHRTVSGDYTHSRVPGTDFGNKKIRIYGLKGDVDLGFATLTSITSYSHIKFNAPQDVTQTFSRFLSGFYDGDTSGYGVPIANYYTNTKWTQELRLSSRDNDPFEWQVGGFFTHERDFNVQSIYPADYQTGVPIAAPDLVHGHYHSTYREFAGFADATYHFSDKLEVQVGGRYSTTRVALDQQTGGLLNGEEDTASARSRNNAFTFLVTPTYHIAKDAILYVRVASGFRPGGPNLVPVGDGDATFSPDRTVNYEVGLKGALLDRKLTVDLSVFDIEWKKIQLLATNADGFSFTSNAGRARSRGVEATVTARPWAGMAINGNFAYTDATLRKSVIVSSLYGLAGDPLPYVSKYAAFVDAEQVFPLPSGVEGYLGGSVAYVGNRQSDFTRKASQPRFDLPAFTTYALRAGLRYSGWEYAIFVKNLTDKKGLVSGIARDTITRTGVFAAGVIQPRTIGLSLSKRF